MKLSRHQLCALILLAALIILFLPWLGLSPFNTKGEPREAIVAVSMLQSGNWILPVSFGSDIPYKPPFLAWCIAVFSLLPGHVTEFTSRLPSALAVIGLCMMLFCTLRRRTALGIADSALAALICATSIEVWRAGMACRVDMVLTFMLVGSALALYRWRERSYRGVPWAAIVMATTAVLTKGPVGALLPCLVAGMYGLARGDRFLPLLLRLTAVALLSFIIPAAWYVAAWQQSGDNFVALALEENVGRVTGTMSYSSHEEGLWYNFATVAAGMLPYTLLCVLALFTLPKRRKCGGGVKGVAGRFVKWLRDADSFKVFSLVMTLTVFVFYCIPKSKRSVYLLPIYPFLAYYMVLLLRHMIASRGWTVRAYSAIIAFASSLVAIAAVALPYFYDKISVLKLCAPPAIGLWAGLAALVGAIYLIWTLWTRKTVWCERTATAMTALTLIVMSASILPAILTAKSDRDIAEEIAAAVPDGTIYSYISFPMLRYYTINFYLNDRVRLYEKELPEQGLILISPEDLPEWERYYGGIYSLSRALGPFHRSCDRRKPVDLLWFEVETPQQQAIENE